MNQPVRAPFLLPAIKIFTRIPVLILCKEKV